MHQRTVKQTLLSFPVKLKVWHFYTTSNGNKLETERVAKLLLAMMF